MPGGRNVIVVEKRRTKKKSVSGAERRGHLAELGYRASAPPAEKLTALRKAVAKHGKEAVLVWLKTLENFTKNAQPKLSKAYRADYNRVRRMPDGSRGAR